MTPNPYNWQSHTSQVQVSHSDVGQVAKRMLSNGSAVVLGFQLTAAEVPDWGNRYRRECLEPLTAEAVSVEGTPISARFAVSSTTADGLVARIDHLLLRLPRR